MKFIGLLSLSLFMTSCVSIEAESVDAEKDLGYCAKQVQKSLQYLHRDTIDYTMMPRNIQNTDSVWLCHKATADEWCAGFWPGVLWYDFEATHDEIIREEAERYTRSLKFLSERSAFDHDLGFLIFCSYGNAYRLTGDPKFKDVILATADTLATLFNPNVGTILSWPRNVNMLGGHNTIMDNMINLEILFWASKNGGGQNLYDIAVKHADTTMKHHFRPDYTCYHVAVYDPETGEFLKGMTHQGYSDTSVWARGQAWAIYGYTMVYRETHEQRFLDFACKVTDAYLKRLPDDYVPYWDFDDPSIPEAPRDASAACVVASALLELQGYCSADKAETYRNAATKMLASLASDSYRSGDKRTSFLDHSTGHKPAGSEVDASIIYADYYYIEALLRYKKLSEGSDILANLDNAIPHVR